MIHVYLKCTNHLPAMRTVFLNCDHKSTCTHRLHNETQCVVNVQCIWQSYFKSLKKERLNLNFQKNKYLVHVLANPTSSTNKAKHRTRNLT